MGKNSFEPYYIPDVPPDSPGNIEQDGAIQKLIRGQFQSANYVRNQQGFTLNSDGSAEFSKISLGGRIITINQEMSIQAAIDDLNTGAGGTINLLPGVYTMPASTVNLYSRINIIGQSPSGTIIDFNNTAGKFAAAGTSAYSTGTITSITGGVNVTGSGTSWLTNVTPLTSQLFIGKRWHLIAAVTSDTTLILAEAYVGTTISAGTAYRIATPVRDIQIKNVQIKNSTGSALDLDDARSILLDNVIFLDNNIGVDVTNCAELAFAQLVGASQTSHGFSFTNVGFCDFEGVSALGNGGSGVVLNGCKTIPFYTSASNANTADGYNITDSQDVVLQVEASYNGSNGIEGVSGNDNIDITDSLINANTSDGIKLTATSDACRISNSKITNNGGYGINIAASTCDNNTILAPYFENNTSGEVNDGGTNTIQIREVQVSFVEYGDGSDGAATISGDTTLTSDKYYSSLTVNSGVTLTTGGYRIYCTGTTTNAGTITNSGGNGGNGGNGSGQTGGTAGTAGAATSAGSLPASKAGVAGAAGGNGGDSSANNAAGGGTGGNAVAESLGTVNVNGLAGVSGGNGGGGVNGFAGASGGSGGSTATTTLATTKVRNFVHATIFSNLDNGVATRLGYCSSNASGGGGGGGGGTSYQGIPQNGGGGGGSGGSGANGGYVFISSRYLVNSGTIKANGGNGGTGGNGADGSRGGGGGGGAGGDGGNGGLVILGYTNLTNTGTIQSAGGTGGTGGSGGAAAGGGTAGSAGTTGTNGQSGLVIQFTT